MKDLVALHFLFLVSLPFSSGVEHERGVIGQSAVQLSAEAENYLKTTLRDPSHRNLKEEDEGMPISEEESKKVNPNIRRMPYYPDDYDTYYDYYDDLYGYNDDYDEYYYYIEKPNYDQQYQHPKIYHPASSKYYSGGKYVARQAPKDHPLIPDQLPLVPKHPKYPDGRYAYGRKGKKSKKSKKGHGKGKGKGYYPYPPHPYPPQPDDGCDIMCFNETFVVPSAALFLAPDTTIDDAGTPELPGTVFLFEFQSILEPDGITEIQGTKVSGTCTRTTIGVDGGGMCELVFVDEDGFTINVEGYLQGPFGGPLSITGGTGGMVGVIGQMDFFPIYPNTGPLEQDIFLDTVRYEVIADLGLVVCP